MEQPTFLKRVSERMWKCAGLFAESKQNHCLARATYPGRPNVQIQAYLCAIVQNLKRLLFSSYSWLVAAGLRFMHREGLPEINQLHTCKFDPSNDNRKYTYSTRPFVFQNRPLCARRYLARLYFWAFMLIAYNGQSLRSIKRLSN